MNYKHPTVKNCKYSYNVVFYLKISLTFRITDTKIKHILISEMNLEVNGNI